MIEQVSNSVKFLAFYVASKVGKTGLTVTIDVYDPGGSVVVNGGSASALGGGLYYYVLSSGSTSSEGEYLAIFKTSDTTVDQQHIPALWVVGRAGIEDLDATISSRLASASYSAPPSAASIRAEIDSNSTKLDATVSSRLASASYSAPPSAASIRAEIDSNSTKLDATVSSRLASASYTTPPTAAANADAVWDEAIAGHLTAGSTGATLSAAGSAGDPWLTELPADYEPGTAGEIIGNLENLFQGSEVTIISPVSEGGDVTIRQGKDYATAINTALIWTLTNPPSPAPSALLFTCRALAFSKTCSYSSPNVTLELTAAETAALSVGVYPFEIEATISGLKHPGLVTGTITVERDV